MRNRRLTLSISFGVLLFAAGAVFVNQQARHSIPLRYAQIPEETRQFLRNLERLAGDMHIRFSEDPVRDQWDNETGEGEDPRAGFLKSIDESFVLYVCRDGDEFSRLSGSTNRSLQGTKIRLGQHR